MYDQPLSARMTVIPDRVKASAQPVMAKATHQISKTPHDIWVAAVLAGLNRTHLIWLGVSTTSVQITRITHRHYRTKKANKSGGGDWMHRHLWEQSRITTNRVSHRKIIDPVTGLKKWVLVEFPVVEHVCVNGYCPRLRRVSLPPRQAEETNVAQN